MAKARNKRRGPAVLLLVLVAVLLAVAGTAAGFAWRYLGTDEAARSAADQHRVDLRAAWSSGTTPSEPAEAQPFALLRVPAWVGWEWPILVGTSDDVLDEGLGWYPLSASPGERGNVAIAGYRIGNGAPFERLLELQVGDQVDIETASAIHHYEIIAAPADLTVQDDDSWVLDAVPGNPEQVPWEGYLTLTTSQDLLPTSDRSVGFARLVSSQPK